MPSTVSPITVETARRLTAYNAKVFARYARAAKRLPWRVSSANRGTGHLSIFRTLVHILNVHEVWMVYIVQGRTDELQQLFLEKQRKPATWDGFDQYASQVWTGVDRYVSSVTAAKLAKPVKAPWMPGRYTAGDAVLQTTFEQAHHLGEIIGVYWQRNEEPPEMTWIDVTRGTSR
jgi:uncharacterized damage-inducible protein DinB